MLDLTLVVNNEMKEIQGLQSLFVEHDDIVVENFVNSIANDHLQIVGSELISGKIYQVFNFPTGGCPIAQNRKTVLFHASGMKKNRNSLNPRN